MAEELFIPQLGQTVEEVTLIEWLAEEGAKVDFGTPILDVETDKAVFPVEANAAGYLHRGPYNNGDIIPVLTVVATIGKKDEVFDVKVSKQPDPSSEPEQPPIEITPGEGIPSETVIKTSEKTFISPRAKNLVEKMNVDAQAITPTGGGGIRIAERDVIAYLERLPKATPLAQNVASREGIDLAQVVGTGTGGTITKADVQNAITERKTVQDAGSILKEPISTPEISPVQKESVPLKGVRKIIFDRMGTSVHTTARVTLVSEVDATRLVEVREQLKARVSESWGFTPGYNDLLAAIVIRALSEHPYMNARLSEDGTEIQYLSSINLGLAVDTEKGLVVPVIKNTIHKGLKEIGLEYRNLIERARAGRSLPDDISGGTFTITNLGMFEIDAFTPVINLPELAILGVGRIAPKAVPVDGQVVIRNMMTLSLVFDHRLVDGAPAAKFLQRIKEYIEFPLLLVG